MSQENGPSYYDVQIAVEYLRDRYGVGVDFVLVSPLYMPATGKRQAWQVCAKAWRLGSATELPFGARESFGAGGAWRTLPAAMHSALLALEAKLQSRELERAAQAAF